MTLTKRIYNSLKSGKPERRTTHIIRSNIQLERNEIETITGNLDGYGDKYEYEYWLRIDGKYVSIDADLARRLFMSLLTEIQPSKQLTK